MVESTKQVEVPPKPPAAPPTLVDSLAQASPSQTILERRLAELGIGVIDALRHSQISFNQASEDFFNLDTHHAARRLQLDPDLREFISWGLELEDVAQIAPEGLNESYDRMTQMATRILTRSTTPTT